MESENVQDEDLTSHVVDQDFVRSKDSDGLDKSPLKPEHIDSNKDSILQMLLDPKECGSQVGRVNGKVSEKEDEEYSRDPAQLSQSSSSDNSSSSSEGSSSSSDEESPCNQNQWSSSVTCTGIKLSVKSLKDSLQEVPCNSDGLASSKAFCEDVKSSRLSDDSSSSDSGGVSPSRVNSLKTCLVSNSLEKGLLNTDASPNSRHSPLNSKGSISNFDSEFGSSPHENSSSDKGSCNVSRNDRQSVDSVGSHLSHKSNDIVFERKLSLSSDSSDSENSRDRSESKPVQSVDPSIQSSLFSSVKSNSSNSNIDRIKLDSNHEVSNELLDSSTCVKFNNVNTARSPEVKCPSPVNENSPGSGVSNQFKISLEESESGNTNSSVSFEHNLNSLQVPSIKISNNVDQSQGNLSNKLMLNSISKTKNISSAEDWSVEFTGQDRDETNCSLNESSSLDGVSNSDLETKLGNNISERSKSDEFNNLVTETECEGASSFKVSTNMVDNEVKVTPFSSEYKKVEISNDLDLDFKSQDMGMEISSDSSLSSDEGMQSHNLSDPGFESDDNEKDPKINASVDVVPDNDVNDRTENLENAANVMEVTGCGSDKESEGTVVDNIKAPSSGMETDSKEPSVDIMNIIGCGEYEPLKETSHNTIMKVIGMETESDRTASDPSKVVNHDGEENRKSKESLEDVMRIIGITHRKEPSEPMDISLEPEKEGERVPSPGSEAVASQDTESCSESRKDSLSVSRNTEFSNSMDMEGELDRLSKEVHSGAHRVQSISESSEDLASTSSIVDIHSDSSSVTKSPSKSKRLLLNDKLDSNKLKKKKLYMTSRLEKVTGMMPAMVSGQKSGESEEEPMAEYAQYLGLQPTLKFKCCICAQIGFESYAELREHQKNCQSLDVGKSSTSLDGSLEKATYPNAEDINQTNFRITRKVYLCSACGTYYENWNLFLHMQEVHHRFICLLCLNMFTMSYKLSDHLILTHGVEVKSYPNLSDFKEAFNCALYVSCTDCGKTFNEGDNWSAHHCLFMCNVCNIKNGHLPRCPRNCIFKNDETASDKKLSTTKCIIRINPSTSSTMILPKPDDKSYDIASSFCSVDIGDDVGSSSGLEPSDTEITESPKPQNTPVKEDNHDNNSSEVSKVVQETNAEAGESKPEDSQMEETQLTEKSSLEVTKPEEEIPSGEIKGQEKSPSKQNEVSNLHPNTSDNPSESQNDGSSESEEEYLGTANNIPVSEDDFKDSNNINQAFDNSNPGDSDGNQGDSPVRNDPKMETLVETSVPTSKNQSDTLKDNFNEMLSVNSRGPQESENLVKCSEMKLIIKKSVLNNPNFRLDSNLDEVEDVCEDLGIDSCKDKDDSKYSKSDSSGSDADNGSPALLARSRSITSPLNCEDENESLEPSSPNPNRSTKESLDFKNLLNPSPKTPNPPLSGSKRDSHSEKEDESNIDASMESPPPVSDDSRMQYESDSQPVSASNPVTNNPSGVNPEQNPSSLPSNDTSDSDSNKLSMAVDNHDVTTDSRSSMKSNPTEEKMMIDYDGDNAVDNFDSDQGSPLRSGLDEDGIELASKEVPAITLPLSGPLESIPLNTLVKECVRLACTACAYCNHALKIAVHARELVLHLLAEHRFAPSRPEESPEKFILLLKNGMDSLENVFFNTNSYDSSDTASNLPYDGTFSCFQCPFWTLQHKDLYTHKRKMHQKTILLCVMCKSNFYSYSELLCHMCPGTYQPNDILFRCCFCHIDKIPSAFRLMVHIRKIHHTCEICLDVSTDQQKLATHMWKHKLHHLCYRCGIAYRNKPDITRHLFWKHGTESVLCKKCLQKKWPHVYHFCIPPATVVCDECNATFTRTVALRVHKRLHSNEKPYACTQCEEKFISKKILEKHEIAHSVKEEEGSRQDIEKKEYDPAVAKSLGLTNPPIQIQKTDEKQNIEVDDDTVPVIRIKKNKTKKAKPMLDLTDLPPLNLSSDSDSEPEPAKPAVASASVEVKAEVEKSEKTDDVKENLPSETLEVKEPVLEMVGDMQSAMTDTAQRLEIIMADHDYCKPQSGEPENSDVKENKPETSVDPNTSLNSTLDTKDTSVSDSSPVKRKSKSPKKKLNKSSNSSSSSSSSDSDSSSCSCGPNCSCSSSSSDSSTSTSSDSDSSNPENRRKQEERRLKKRERVKTKSPKTDSQPDPVISVENEEPYIMESDLDTDITLTDEDFYDEYPQQHANKMLAEKQQSDKDQLMLLASVAPTHTAPSSPIVSAEETPAPQPALIPKLKKKLKTKRKRDEALVPTSAVPNTQSFEPDLLQVPSTLSLITKLPNPNARNYSMPQTPNSEHFSDRTLSTGGSGSESESKRSSKRRRTKNRFYGYSSEEENQAENSKPRFKPKKLKKVVAMRKSEPTLTRPNPFKVSFPLQPPSMSSQHSYQQHQPSITIKPVLPPVTNFVRSTLPPVRLRPPSPSSSSDSDDDKLNIDEKFPEPPQASYPPAIPPPAQPTEKNANLYCYCQCPYDEVSEMIACDGDDCRIEWFHFECVGIMVPPKGQWFCPDCRKKKNLSY